MNQTRRQKREVKVDCGRHRFTRRNKLMEPSCDEDDQYAKYGRDQIVENLLVGGGLITREKRYSRKATTELINELVRRGWDTEFVHNALRHLDDEMLIEYPNTVFIKKYFTALIRKLGFQGSVYKSLLSIGLREDVVDLLTSMLEPLLGSSYTNEQVLDTAIYYLQDKYIPISPPNTTHVIQPKLTDKWFNYTHETKPVLLYNLGKPCRLDSEKAFRHALTSLPKKNDEYVYLFHTTSWKGSFNIMEGVDHRCGRNCLDFGIFPGFYLSKSSTVCLDWGSKKAKLWSDEVAVMIFSVPLTLPSHLEFKHLSGDEWVAVTQESRRCRQESREVRSVMYSDLLYGDMVSNPALVKESNQLPKTHKPPKKQIASKTTTGDKFLNTCLIGCMYFQKYFP
jgi:hypothetical protein